MTVQQGAIRGILLDIEGTTSSISFVHDVMFPYAAEHLDAFLDANWNRPEVQSACDAIAEDAGHRSLAEWSESCKIAPQALVREEVRRQMDRDAKATGLKALQGLIWEVGFRSGQMQAHVYPDVLPAIHSWRTRGYSVRIYSSGSIAAQKLFFGHVRDAGDCLALFDGHYDTTFGGKKDSASYRRIAQDWGLPPQAILFLSDVAEELTAASAIGMRAIASVRPGNRPLPEGFPLPTIHRFDQVDAFLGSSPHSSAAPKR